VWHPKADHLAPALRRYRAFINASTSDVLATTSLEALAMGKWLVCAAHPCNAWAATFRNALPYSTRAEFGAALATALAADPAPLSAAELAALGWEAATERLAVACLGPPEEEGAGGGGTKAGRRARRPGAGGGPGGRKPPARRPPLGPGPAARAGGTGAAPPGPDAPAPPAHRRPPPSVRALRRRAARAAEAAFAAVYRAALSVEAVRIAACAGAGTAGLKPAGLAADGLTYCPPPSASPATEGSAADSGSGGAHSTVLGAAFLAFAASRPALRLRVRAGGGSLALWSAGSGRVGGGGLAPPREEEEEAAAAAPHHGYAYGGLSVPWEL